MTDHQSHDINGERTIVDIIAEVDAMGDLRRFVIEDLTPDEEDEFFSILRDA